MASKEQQWTGGAASKSRRKAFGVASLQQMGDPVGDNTAGKAGQGSHQPGPSPTVPERGKQGRAGDGGQVQATV